MKTRRKPMTILDVQSWLNRAERVEVKAAIQSDCYSVAYPHLIRQFESFKASIGWTHFVVGLHVVYGWMPRIPDLEYICNRYNGVASSLAEEDQCNVLNAMRSAIHARSDLNEEAAANIIQTLFPYTNRSLVGASKLLHFLNPAVFPIWDSRVAHRFFKTFGRPSQLKMSDIKHWKQYFAAIVDWRNNTEVKQACVDLRKLGEHFNTVTDTRMIELVLFHPAPTNWRKVKER